MNKTKVLFILKRREDYNAKLHTSIGLETGLYNSASYVHHMLLDSGIESVLEVVNDNNDIDREVTKYNPSHVIIEALWVVPSKFEVLCKLHPNIKWIVRLHSELPFLANEGIAMNWIGEYISHDNVMIGVNAPRALKEIRYFLTRKYQSSIENIKEKVIYLPNYYPQEFDRKKLDRTKDTINIGCFGAIRPLKNQLLQAIAAVKFADKIGKKLNFHINVGRMEMKGEPVYHNLVGMFNHLDNAELITHEWAPREKFLEICKSMDLGMQCSFSETFNIVAADLVSQGVPIVGSTEIPWMDSIFCAKPVETNSIYRSLILAYYLPQFNVISNQLLLKDYTAKTKRIWSLYFKN